MKRLMIFVVMSAAIIMLAGAIYGNGIDYAALTEDIIGFGVTIKEDILCSIPGDPELPALAMSQFQQSLQSQIRNDDAFVAFDEYIIEDYLDDVRGDTVMIISRGDKVLATIEHIGYYIGACYQDYFYKLSPVDIKAKPLESHFIVFMGERANYDGILVPYAKQPLNDETIEKSIEFMDRELAGTYPSDRELQIDHGLFQAQTSSPVDSFFLFLSAPLGSESRWMSSYRIIRSGEDYEFRVISDPQFGSWMNLHCALDFDGDGQIEYLMMSGDVMGIFRLEEDGFEPLVLSRSWGC